MLLQVRTLFVSGLPVDIKPRELYLLFRPFKVGNREEVMLSAVEQKTFLTLFFPGAGSESWKVFKHQAVR